MSAEKCQPPYSKNLVPLSMDYVSAFPVAFIFVNVLEAVEYKNFGEMFLYIVAILGADLTTLGIKQISRYAPKELGFLLDRPVGAFNTDVLSRNGAKSPHSPGFPSGHVAAATVFAMYRLLRLYRGSSDLYKFIHKHPLEILFYLGLIFIMGFARWYKRCHNIYQIIGGFIVGVIFAVVLDKIIRDFI